MQDGKLHDFLTQQRDTILAVAKKKAQESRWARITSDAVEEGWTVFYEDLTSRLQPEVESQVRSDQALDKAALEKRGKDYLRLGYAVSEVVQSYSIIYQSITESAISLGVEITPVEFQKLNVSLDTAVADVVKEFELVQTEAQDAQTDAKEQREAQRLGFLAHELRNCLQSATVALEMMEQGVVAVKSRTGVVLHNSLEEMAVLIDRALAEARLRMEPEVQLRKLRVFEVLNEVGVTAGFQAREREVELRMQGGADLCVLVDRHLLISTLSNLVQNALKFSQKDGTVDVRTRAENGRVLIDVEDTCGGLPEGKIEELFEPGVQKSNDRSGAGLGLTISRQAVERNKGKLRVKNLPGKGCIFTIDLPQAQESQEAV